MTIVARTVLITGASSGIGRALALAYAVRGTHLYLIGRNASRLSEVADACRLEGAEVTTGEIDIRDRAALACFVAEQTAVRPLDLAIVNAGLTTGTPEDGIVEPAEESYLLAEVNFIGALNTVHAVLPSMIARQNGQIALVSSIAGLIALPDSPTYCATKSGLIAYGTAMRGALRGAGIRVNVICPGFVTTPMSARLSGWKPLEATPERAAQIIISGLNRNKAIIAFPRLLAFLARAGSRLPEPVLRLFLWAFRFTTAPPKAS